MFDYRLAEESMVMVGDGTVFNHEEPFSGLGIVAPGGHILTTACAFAISSGGMMLLPIIHEAKVRGLYEPHCGAIARRQMLNRNTDIAVLVGDPKGAARGCEELDRLLARRRPARINLKPVTAGPCAMHIRLVSGAWVRAKGTVRDSLKNIELVAERVKDITYEDILGAPCFNDAGEVVAFANCVFGARMFATPVVTALSRRLARIIRRFNKGQVVSSLGLPSGVQLTAPEIQS